MKATTLISALVFAYGAFAQASESMSTSVSAGSVPASSSTATGGKSASKSGSQTSSAASTPTPQPSSTGGNDSLSESRTTLIPSSISAACSSFLTSLNTDKEIADCLNPLSDAVSAYSSNSGSASGLSKTLDSLCDTSNSCSHTTMIAKLTEFKDSCGPELTGDSPDQTVIGNYDAMYAVIPYRDAMCSKVDVTYCLLDSKAGSSVANTTSSITPAANSGSSRRKRAQTFLAPNAKYYRENNLMYLSTSPGLDKDALCTKCAQQVVAKYTAFQYSVPHALGVQNSPLLSGLTALWKAFSETCGGAFTNEIYKIANVQSADDINSSGALPAFSGSIFTAVAGALAVVAALI